MPTDSPKQHAVIFSYWPLLDPTKYAVAPGEQLELGGQKWDGVSKVETMLKDMEETLPNGRAELCLWTMKTNEAGETVPAAVLMMAQAKAVRDHLLVWAENDLTRWFKLYLPWEEVPGQPVRRYGLVLMPNITESIARWQTARVLLHGELPPEDAVYTVLFQPICFGTGGALTIDKVRMLLGDSLTVYLLDKSYLSSDKPVGPQIAALRDDDFIEIGTFPLPAEQRGPASLGAGDAARYLQGWLKDLMDPAGGSDPTASRFRGWINHDVNI